MHLYVLENTLREIDSLDAVPEGKQYAAVVDRGEWERLKPDLGIRIDLEFDVDHILTTEADVNRESLTGSFSIPDRAGLQDGDRNFAFAMDARGIVFIQSGGEAEAYIAPIAGRKQWRDPSLERFLYDLLESIVGRDLPMLEELERKLSRLEEDILSGEAQDVPETITHVRRDLLTLRTHYEQLLDIGQEFNENENGFFDEKNLRYFDMFCARIMRLQDYVTTLREYTIQVRDLYQAQLSERQNNIVTLLTVATVVFTPLTLITGWYGMNFRYMPELEWPGSYPVVIAVCLLIAVGCIVWFKKKKWL